MNILRKNNGQWPEAINNKERDMILWKLNATRKWAFNRKKSKK